MTTQQDCSLGLAAETTYGVGVTPTKFPEFTDEDFDWNPTFLQGAGLRVGSRVARLGRRALGKQMVGGGFTVEAASKGLGALLEAALGAVTTNQRATTGVYQQNHTPTAGALKSYTIQKGLPPVGGAAQVPMTFRGMVCDSIDFSIANAGFLMVKTAWTGKEVDRVPGYAAPSYPAAPVELFVFSGGAITLGGTVVEPTTTAAATGGTAVADILDFNATYTNNVDDGGVTFGSGGKRSRKPEVGMAPISGKMTAEFDTTTLLDAYLNQSDLGIVLSFLGTTTIGSGTDKPLLQIRIPAIRLEGELPKANGGDVITQDVGFTGLDNGTNPPITIVYASTDTTP